MTGQVADIRLQGFASRTPLAELQRTLDTLPVTIGHETLPLQDAAGRRLARPVTVPGDLPAADCALEDGFAVRAEATLGAGPYSPILLAEPGLGADAQGAVLVAPGDPLPQWADAVVRFDVARRGGPGVQLVDAVAPGQGVLGRARVASAGALLLPTARPLGPLELALLAAADIQTVAVVRQPRVALLLPGARPAGQSASLDPDRLLLEGLLLRDGASPHLAGWGEAALARLTPGLAAEVDLVIVAGRTGTGAADVAPSTLAAFGRLELHGVALHPGGSLAMGWLGRTPVLLLPGDPVGCLVAYELAAGRLVRRQAARPPDHPLPRAAVPLAQKIVSGLGVAECVFVALHEGIARPLGIEAAGGIAGLAAADGFVLVPAPIEGHAAGTVVEVACWPSPSGASAAAEPGRALN